MVRFAATTVESSVDKLQGAEGFGGGTSQHAKGKPYPVQQAEKTG